MSKIRLVDCSGVADDDFPECEWQTLADETIDSRGAQLQFVNLDSCNVWPENMFLNAWHHATPTGVLVAFASRMPFSINPGRWMWHDDMVWVHTNPPLSFPNARSYYSGFTHMFVFAKSGEVKFHPISEMCKNGMSVVELKRRSLDCGRCVESIDIRTVGTNRIRTGVWYCGKDHDRSDPSADILAAHIVSWTDFGDTVVDWTSDDGTIADVCRRLDRNAICFMHGSDTVENAERMLSGGNSSPLDDRQMSFGF